MPQDQPTLQLWKRADDKKPFNPLVMRPANGNFPEDDLAQRQGDDAERAHNTAVKAGGFRKFGAGPVDKGT
jgi:hypothetical protein